MSDLNAGASIALVCAIISLSSLAVTFWFLWFWFLCRMTGNDSQNKFLQDDLKVLKTY